MELLISILLALLILVGAFFSLVGSLGLIRFSSFFTRLHAPTKASTLGLGCLLIASILSAWWEERGGFAELLITIFVFLTAPVSAAALAEAALRTLKRSK